ncbi:MAG: high-potential iron-sulfur protein [Candidatus Eremiobacteraeota bacterium]|nr:high-potential iron-sulfur protein [Candidatus Eremiobacteraeota bacterium]
MKDDSQNRTRADALKQIVLLPALAAALAGGALPAVAADNKKQFKYQDKPGKNGEKCSTCSLFKPPSSCSVVTGKISPNGWCVAWSKK